MALASKTDTDTGNIDLTAIRNDIASLRSDLASLIHGLGKPSTAVLPRARIALAELGDQARHVGKSLTEQGGRAAKAVGDQVGQQPLIALLLAFGLGFVGSRILSR